MHFRCFQPDAQGKTVEEVQLEIFEDAGTILHTLQKEGVEARLMKEDVQGYGTDPVQTTLKELKDLEDLKDIFFYIDADLTNSRVSFKKFNELLKQWKFEVYP